MCLKYNYTVTNYCDYNIQAVHAGNIKVHRNWLVLFRLVVFVSSKKCLVLLYNQWFCANSFILIITSQDYAQTHSRAVISSRKQFQWKHLVLDERKNFLSCWRFGPIRATGWQLKLSPPLLSCWIKSIICTILHCKKTAIRGQLISVLEVNTCD